MKKLLVALWLMLLVLAIGNLFWYNQYRYSLPTPLPAKYKVVATGTAIRLPHSINKQQSKPVFLHFFNPDCPCSRFNVNHVKALVKQYGQQVSFVVILVAAKNYTAKQIQDKYKLNIPVLQDAALAAACGVYSTPQAVILTNTKQLFFRGNYNSSRYCTNKTSEYARQALNNLLHNLPAMHNPSATRAYGCSLADLNPGKYVNR
ncbi:thioredoxin fold domain-containing protein [Mucilaginibacter terrae]|uniref:DUF6436 domain-containing protein n=1 Tax=Mucilaginibacter terrae TaxID=1955052 RepID=UPI003645C0A0